MSKLLKCHAVSLPEI